MTGLIEKKKSTGRRPERVTAALSLGLLVAGAAGYFTLSRGDWLFLVSAHAGALGVLGLLGSATGALARKKKRGFYPAFATGVVLPVVLGLAAVAIFYFRDGGQLYCGGAVSLPVSLAVLGVFALVRSKPGARPQN